MKVRDRNDTFARKPFFAPALWLSSCPQDLQVCRRCKCPIVCGGKEVSVVPYRVFKVYFYARHRIAGCICNAAHHSAGR